MLASCHSVWSAVLLQQRGQTSCYPWFFLLETCRSFELHCTLFIIYRECNDVQEHRNVLDGGSAKHVHLVFLEVAEA